MSYNRATALLVTALVIVFSAGAALAQAESSALSAPLKPSDISLKNMTITIKATGDSFVIPPASTKHHELTGTIKPGKPSWRAGLRLHGPAWIYNCLTPGSLKVTNMETPEKVYTEGKDYLVDLEWASVTAAPGSEIKPNTKLSFSYDYGLSRLDLLVKDASGKLSIIRGTEDKGRPPLPKTPEGATALLSVYLPPNTTTLTLKNINFIDPAFSMTPTVRLPRYTKKCREKLASDQGLTVVFLGDSITAQKDRDFTDGKGSFVQRFATYLENRFGKDRVIMTTRDNPVEAAAGKYIVVQSGVGGNTTRDAVKRLQSDVIDHKPDLVIVLFGANDENRRGDGNNVGIQEYRDNLTEITTKCKAAGAEVMILTPAMKNLNWEATFGNMDQYARMADMVAESVGATLVDCFNVWENMPKLGYNYMVALGTCINHPVDIGHDIFVLGIIDALEKGE